MPFSVRTPSASTSEPYRYEEKANFTGGLNLRADQFNLLENESPAMLNVEVDPRGGVRRRDAVTKVNATALTNEIVSLFAHYEAGQNQVLAAVLDPVTTTSTLQWNDEASGDFEGTVSYGGTDIRRSHLEASLSTGTRMSLTASCWQALGTPPIRRCVGTERMRILL